MSPGAARSFRSAGTGLRERTQVLALVLRRHPRRFFLLSLSIAAGIWLVGQIVLESLGSNPFGVLLGPVLLAASLCAGLLVTMSEVSGTRFRLTPTATLRIRFGDLFESGDEAVLIPVNEYFDDRVGSGRGVPVDRRSLHGQFVLGFMPGADDAARQAAFRDAVDRVLETREGDAVPPTERHWDPTSGPELPATRYPLGESVILPEAEHEGGFDVCLTAVCRTSVDAQRQHILSDAQLAELVHAFARGIRAVAGRSTIAIPLVGSGFARIHLTRRQLLEVLIACIAEECQRSNLASTFTIVLPPTMRGELPLYALKTEWAYERPATQAPMA